MKVGLGVNEFFGGEFTVMGDYRFRVMPKLGDLDEASVFVGLGGLFSNEDISVRVPVGIDYAFPDKPFSFDAELAPALNFDDDEF